MRSILELYKKTEDIDHAYLLIGDVRETVEEVNKIIEEISGRSISGNPDYYSEETGIFKIEESRRLREASQKRSVSGGKRFFVVGANVFTEEAQNALLKVLEEPIPGHHFFVVVPDEYRFLPTVKSRLKKVDGRWKDKKEGESLCDRFLSAGVADRLLMIEEIVDEDAEPGERRAAVRELVSRIEEKIFEEHKRSEFVDREKFGKIMADIIMVRKYSGDISSAPRLLLEYLSFAVPHSTFSVPK